MEAGWWRTGVPAAARRFGAGGRRQAQSGTADGLQPAGGQACACSRQQRRQPASEASRSRASQQASRSKAASKPAGSHVPRTQWFKILAPPLPRPPSSL